MTTHRTEGGTPIKSQLKPVYAELRDSCVARVYLADSVDGVLAQMRTQTEALRGFVEECANDNLDRISPGLKSKALALLNSTQPTKA